MVIYFCELKATYYHTAITIYEPNGTVHVAQLQFPNNKSNTMFTTVWCKCNLFADEEHASLHEGICEGISVSPEVTGTCTCPLLVVDEH